MKKTKIAIVGVTGRMGRALLEASQMDADVDLGGAVTKPGCSSLGKDAGDLISQALGVTVQESVEKVAPSVDVLIDFTLPDASIEHVQQCRRAGRGVVIGTTGFSVQQKAAIKEWSSSIPIVLAPNMSVGVNLSYRLIELAARVMGDDSDIEIIEAHHRHKIDAPSGTALRMGEVVAAALNRDLSKDAIYARQGQTGERERRTIGFSTIRAGDIVGEHTVMFAANGDRLEITHKASSRLTFANGAIRAAKWLKSRQPGLYDMQDVLGLT